MCWVAPHDPDEIYPARLAEPSGEFPLGTDNIGRDIFSRLVYGARPSIGSVAVATAIILLIGVTAGVGSGYIGGLLDDVAMRIVDILQAFPLLILALAIVGILGPGLQNVLLAVILVVWASFARLVRLNTRTSSSEIYLKIESLNPTGSFKLRGASDAIRLTTKEQLERGVYTASSGNMELCTMVDVLVEENLAIPAGG